MKVLFIISFITISKITFSQLWFDLGLKGGIGTGFLINKTISSIIVSIIDENKILNIAIRGNENKNISYISANHLDSQKTV